MGNLTGKLCEQCQRHDKENFKEEAMYSALTQNHGKCIEQLTAAGADVNFVHRPRSLLERAAASGSVDNVRLLLKAGADVNQTNPGVNYAALLGAVVAGSVECTELLIEAGADVNLRQKYCTSPIIQAVQKGYPEIVQVLLKAGADVNDIDVDNSWTALMLAAWNGHDDVVDVLIKAGADVNRERLNDTALKLASECSTKGTETPPRQYKHCLEMLIEAGADVNANPDRVSALNIACRKGFDDGVELMVKAGADVNMLGDTGFNPLMEAASNGHVRCAELIIEAGADVNFQNDRGITALICVGSGTPLFDYQGEISWWPKVIEKKDCLSCINVLLRSRAKINVTDMLSLNALQHQVAQYDGSTGSDDICLLLYAAGEILDGPTGAKKLPDCLKFEALQLNLKHLCREVIRNHLLDLDPHSHLFDRIPQLGLPSLMTEILLYNVSLEQ